MPQATVNVVGAPNLDIDKKAVASGDDWADAAVSQVAPGGSFDYLIEVSNSHGDADGGV